MPMVDALVIWAEEGRVFKRDNNGESLNRRYQSLVSEWSNPPARNGGDPDLLLDCGGEPGELKHLSIRRKRNHMRFR